MKKALIVYPINLVIQAMLIFCLSSKEGGSKAIGSLEELTDLELGQSSLNTSVTSAVSSAKDTSSQV